MMHLAALADPSRVAASVAARALAPPPSPDFNRWAEDNLEFGRESPFPGPYDPTRFPYFRRILEVLGPEHVAREVALMKSAQLGGTVLAQIFIAAAMDLDPGPMLYVHPTEGNATRWVKTKWKPMQRQVKALGDIFGGERSRDGDNSTLYQERRDGRGHLIIGGANSAASLSMISVSRQVQDDLSKWEMNAAGDPESQADSRSKAFDWAKVLKVGTPLLEHSCRITAKFKRSTQEHWHVPCPHCSTLQPLEWENMLAALDEKHPELAHFTCTACGCAIEHRHKEAMNAGGRWVAHNPGASIVGFYLWSAVSPLERWENIASAWIGAKGDPAKEQTFLNDVVGRAYKQAGEAPPWEAIRERANAGGHARGTVPPGGLILVAAIDTQDDRLEWHVKAFGRERKRWTVDYGVIPHAINSAEGRAALERLFKRSWPDSFGNWRGLDQLAIDAGGHFQMEVVSWARAMREPLRIMVVRGSKFENAAPCVQRASDEMSFRGRVVKTGVKLWWVGVSKLKGALYEDLKKADPIQRGYVGFPAGLDDEFYRQLCAEKRIGIKNKSGFEEFRWVKESSARNEVLDTEIYAEAAAIRCQWNRRLERDWEILAAQRERPPEAKEPELFGPGLDLPQAASAPPVDVLEDPPQSDAPIDEEAAPADAPVEVIGEIPATPAPTVPVMGARRGNMPRRSMIRGRFAGF